MPTDPFEKHPAMPEVLESRAETLMRLAEEAGDHQVITDQAFNPAVASWDGVAAAELQAAPVALRKEAKEVASKVAWAAVPLLAWAEQVRTFNRKVDHLRDREAEVPAQVERFIRERYVEPLSAWPQWELDNARLVKRHELLRALRQEWYDALDLHIDEGERAVAGMLTHGPNWDNLDTARQFGAIPAGPLAEFFDARWSKAAALSEAERIAAAITGPANATVTIEDLERFAEILSRYADDEEFAYLLLTELGQAGLLDLTMSVAMGGGGHSDERVQHAIGAIQTGLATALATATTRRGTGGTNAYDPYQPATFELGGEWIVGLTTSGRELFETTRLGQPMHLYGYQALGVLLHHGGFDDQFLVTVGTTLIDFEIAQGGSDFWPTSESAPDGTRLTWLTGTGPASPAGFDPLAGLMNALAESPEATRAILTGQVRYAPEPIDPNNPESRHESVRTLPRLGYLLTDREWPLDLVVDPATAHLPPERATSLGIAALGRALEGAALVDPDERSAWIVESIIYETATDEQAMGLPNGKPDHRWADTFQNVDIIHPDLRQSLAVISDFYIQDLHWVMADTDPSSFVPHDPRLDLGQIDRRHLQIFLADLGKDAGARDTLAAAQYTYAAELYEHYLDGWEVGTLPPAGVHAGVTGAVTKLIAALDVGATSQLRADLAASDTAANDALQSRFFWVGLGTSVGTDLIPGGRTTGYIADTSLAQLEQSLQHESTGRANYYHGDMKDMSRQILTDMINHAAYSYVTNQMPPGEFFERLHPNDVEEAQVLIYPDGHPRAGDFVPIGEWGEGHYGAWEKFYTAPDNRGIHELIADTEQAYNANFLTVQDDLAASR